MSNPFSAKKKRYVATSVTRVVKDNQIEALGKRSALKTVLDNSDFTKTLLRETLHSPSMNLLRAYRYAKDGGYYYGTPSHDVFDAADGRTAVQTQIETDLGEPVTLDYYYYAPINNLHEGWKWLTETYGYDEFSNSLTYNNQTWYVKNLEGVIDSSVWASDDPALTNYFPSPDDGTLAVWGRHPQDRYTPFRVAGAPKDPVWVLDPAAVDGVNVYLIDKDGNETTLFYDMSAYSDDAGYFQVKYRSSAGIGYFTYQHEAGTYPALDALFAGQAVGNGTFMPLVLFRHDNVNRTAVEYHGTAAYQTSVKLMNIMGMDYQAIGDQIQANPDAGKIEQAVMMFAIPANSTHPADLQYLFRFFDWLFLQSPATGTQYKDRTALNSTRPGMAIKIADADFSTTLSFSSLRKRTLTGQVGAVGDYVAESITETLSRTVRECGDDGTGNWVCSNVVKNYDVITRRYKFQRYADKYEQVEVVNLQMRYDIWDINEFATKNVTVNLDQDPEKLLIPVDYNIAQSMRFQEKEQMLWRSMHFVINSMETRYVRWYETGFFQAALFIAAVIITVNSAGAGSAAYAAIAAGAYGVAAMIILQHVVIALAMKYLFDLVVEELGVEFALVLAAVMAAYGLSSPESVWSTNLLQASVGLERASEASIKQQVADYQSESQEFALMAEEKMNALEEIEKDLNPDTLLDPFRFIGKIPAINPGDTPDEVYNRTVHSGNIGTVAFDYIESFVDISLQLPTLQDNVRDLFYGN